MAGRAGRGRFTAAPKIKRKIRAGVDVISRFLTGAEKMSSQGETLKSVEALERKLGTKPKRARARATGAVKKGLGR